MDQSQNSRCSRRSRLPEAVVGGRGWERQMRHILRCMEHSERNRPRVACGCLILNKRRDCVDELGHRQRHRHLVLLRDASRRRHLAVRPHVHGRRIRHGHLHVAQLLLHVGHELHDLIALRDAARVQHVGHPSVINKSCFRMDILSHAKWDRSKNTESLYFAPIHETSSGNRFEFHAKLVST